MSKKRFWTLGLLAAMMIGAVGCSFTDREHNKDFWAKQRQGWHDIHMLVDHFLLEPR